MTGQAGWGGRSVLVTGHTGFKGAWLALFLERLGARVTGFALAPDTTPSLFEVLSPWPALESHIGDVRDGRAVADLVRRCAPEIVFHLAAQPLVRRAYRQPLATLETNVMGTAHLLHALAGCPTVRVVIVVTSDKVYENRGAMRPFRETDPFGGDEPYSASKAAAEIVTRSMARSYLSAAGIRVVTARAGNVIGGGDWAEDRLIPDLWRACESGVPAAIRYPDATRPWQHVLEPLTGYLAYAEALLADAAGGLPDSLNFGPVQAGLPVRAMCEMLSESLGVVGIWVPQPGDAPPETPHLAIDSSVARETLGWHPRLDVTETVEWTVRWYVAYRDGRDMREFTGEQISRYLKVRPA